MHPVHGAKSVERIASPSQERRGSSHQSDHEGVPRDSFSFAQAIAGLKYANSPFGTSDNVPKQNVQAQRLAVSGENPKRNMTRNKHFAIA